MHAPALSLIETLRAMSEAELLDLVDLSSPEHLKKLWDVAGIDDADCACGDTECSHPPQEGRDWYLPPAVMARLLKRLDAEEYSDPPLASAPTLCFLPKHKTEVLAQRHSKRRAIAHPGDFNPRDLKEQVERPVRNNRNGTAAPGTLRIYRPQEIPCGFCRAKAALVDGKCPRCGLYDSLQDELTAWRARRSMRTGAVA